MSNDMNYSSIARYNGRLHKGAELHNVSALIVHDTQSAKNWKSHEILPPKESEWMYLIQFIFARYGVAL
ncbi:hypothetical protein ACMFMG_007076 [Clarireedia jacksonii]